MTDATGRPPEVVPPTEPYMPADPLSPGPPTQDDATAWATAQPVVPAANPKRPRGRLRWAAAIAIVAIVLGASAAVAALITGASTTSVVVGYVPADTTIYGELRLDLPGDQRQALGTFLQKFPGFADQANLDSKVDQVLDDLVRQATDGAHTYSAEIEPWFGGEIAYSVGGLPAPSAAAEGDAFGSARMLVVASVKDADLASAWIDAILDEHGMATTTEDYQGTTIVLLDASDGPQPAYALADGRVALFGDLASVKAAIDSDGSGGFASEPGPKAAFASVDGDYVGFSYVAIRPLIDASGGLAGGAATAALSGVIADLIPDWTASWLRFEDDAIVVQGSAPQPTVAIGPTANGRSDVIDHVPGDAVLAVTTNDVGDTVQQVLDLVASDPATGSMLDGLDQALGLVGGADGAYGWIGDAAIVVESSGAAPDGGIIIAPTDPDAPQRLLTSLQTFIALGGSQAGLTVSDETYGGATITTIDLGSLGDLAGMAGGDAIPLPIPSDHVQISITVADGVVVIGSGPGFVKSVIDTTSDTSLAAKPSYKELNGRAGPSTRTLFVDVAAVRAIVEQVMTGADPAARSDYETDAKPFLEPFTALFGTTSVDGDLIRYEMFVTVN